MKSIQETSNCDAETDNVMTKIFGYTFYNLYYYIFNSIKLLLHYLNLCTPNGLIAYMIYYLKIFRMVI